MYEFTLKRLRREEKEKKHVSILGMEFYKILMFAKCHGEKEAKHKM